MLSATTRQPSKFSAALKILYEYRQTLVTIAVPLLLLPLIFNVGTKEAKAIFVIIVMVFYWNFEVVPIGITALIPIVLVPLLGIMPSRDICAVYFKELNLLFLGGLILQVCIETWNLHKRVAIRLLQIFGVQPRWLLFGCMLPPWILAMWMANTACVALMLPFAEATMVELRRHFRPSRQTAVSRNSHHPTKAAVSYNLSAETTTGADRSAHPALEMNLVNSVATVDKDDDHPDEQLEPEEEPYKIHEIETRRILREAMADTKKSEYLDVTRMLVLSVPFGAYFGGVGSLSGTSPNAVLLNTVQEYFGSKTSLNYVSWLGFGMPIAVITFLVAWVWLQISFLGFRGLLQPGLSKRDRERVSAGLRRNYEILGPMTYAEINVLTILLVTIVLWISREQGVPGWSIAFLGPDPKSSAGTFMNYITNTQPAILAAALVFFLPSRNPWKQICRCCCARRSGSSEAESQEDPPTPDRPARLMSWKQMQEKLGWIIVLCLGGGLALTEVSKTCGLSDWFGQLFLYLKGLPQVALLFIVCLFTALFTEWTSNLASANTMLTMLAKYTPTIGINPLYFMLPCTASCSFAFSLPVTVPSHILIYSRGYLRVVDALRTGCVMWLLSNCIVALATITYAPALFGLYEFPDWAKRNVTLGG